MNLSPHPDSGRLAEAIQRCRSVAKAWAGDVFRFTEIDFANLRDLVTGEGSRRVGGRWNPKESFRTLYFCLDPETALAEVLDHRRRQGLPDAEATPQVLICGRVKVQRLLDLTDARIRRLLGVTRRQIEKEPWRSLQHAGREALTQAIGRLSCEAGWQGMLAPSAARSNGRNLVLFRDCLSENEITVVHPEKYPLAPRRIHRPEIS